MIYHVSIQHIHPRRVMHGDNSRGVPNASKRKGGRVQRIYLLCWQVTLVSTAHGHLLFPAADYPTLAYNEDS